MKLQHRVASQLVFPCLLATLGASCSGSVTNTAPADYATEPQNVQLLAAVQELAPEPAVDPVLFEQVKAEFIKLVMNGSLKQSASPPLGEWNEIKDFRLVEDPPGTYYLEWTYQNTGDNDLNSEVNISDLTPIGTYFQAKLGDANWDEAQAADGDGNGEVNISDVTPVGLNYTNYVKEYIVYSSPSIDDHPARNNGENGPGVGQIGVVNYGAPPSTSGIRLASATGKVTLRFELASPPANAYFWVRPAGNAGDHEGVASIAGGGNPAELPVLSLTNPPSEGSGSLHDPYLLQAGQGYTFALHDPLAGEVTSEPATRFLLTDRYAGEMTEGVLNLHPRYSGDFAVQALYLDKPAFWDSIVYCRVVQPMEDTLDWLQFRQGPSRTGRSTYPGAPTNTKAWECVAGTFVGFSSPVLASGGMIYIGSGDAPGENRLTAIRPDGTVQWTYDTNYSNARSSPAIGPDGTIYIGDMGHRLHALSPAGDGSILYRADAPIGSSPLVLADGSILFGAGAELYSITSEGVENWRYATDGVINSSPAASSSGTIYIGSDDQHLHAVSPTGGMLWKFDTGYEVRSTPAVAPDGTVYVAHIDHVLLAISSEGELEWEYELAPWWVLPDVASHYPSPAIGADGTVYIGTPYQSADVRTGVLNAIWPDGTERWTTYLPGDIYSSPAIGAGGTVYVGSGEGGVYAYEADGTLRWHYFSSTGFLSSPAISADGFVYIGCADGRLYAFGNAP